MPSWRAQPFRLFAVGLTHATVRLIRYEARGADSATMGLTLMFTPLGLILFGSLADTISGNTESLSAFLIAALVAVVVFGALHLQKRAAEVLGGRPGNK